MFQLPIWLPILSIQLLTHKSPNLGNSSHTVYTFTSPVGWRYCSLFRYLVGYLEHAARAVEAKGAALQMVPSI